jgi:hypothetical protein
MAVGTVPLAVLGQRSGQPEQGELAQRRQGSDAERTGQCRFGVFAWVDLAVGYPVSQCFGRHIYQLDLVRGADDRVRHGLPGRDAGDLFCYVGEGIQVPDADCGDHVDAGRQQFSHVLPSAGIA